MQVPASLHPLLSCFTLEVRSSLWWQVVDEYLDGGLEANVGRLPEELESLAATPEDDGVLSDALVEAGCYFWPELGTSQRAWLRAVATRIRRWLALGDRKGGKRRPIIRPAQRGTSE